MKRSEFIQTAINNPKKAADILQANAKKLKKCKNVTSVAKALSETLFISDRTVFRDCKK